MTKMNALQKLVLKLKLKYDIYELADLLPYRWRHWYWDNIKPIIKPAHKRLRKSIPRQWQDITSLIVNLNFEFIKSFYEDEYKQGIVDWEGTSKEAAKFEKWLNEAYRYIVVERPILQKRQEEAYPPSKPFDEMFKPIGDGNYELVDDGIPYEVKYKAVNELEEKIETTDTEILKKLIKYRDYFWT
jgi:hypothetical protein